MRSNTIWMLTISFVFGLLAVLAARTWLHSLPTDSSVQTAKEPSPPMRTVVIATIPLKFGEPLTEKSLGEVSWPVGAIPAGTFTTIAQAVDGGRRTVLAAIHPNEPILRSKVTGTDQRATLSALLAPDMKAVSIRVNDVGGVAGFIVPGDHVDVLMTHQKDGSPPRTEIVLQKARVLAVDQNADDSATKPSVVKAVTLEVDLASAQKLSIAGATGALSLALRRAGELIVEGPQTASEGQKPSNHLAKVTVFRGAAAHDYTVLMHAQPAPLIRPATGTPTPRQRMAPMANEHTSAIHSHIE